MMIVHFVMKSKVFDANNLVMDSSAPYGTGSNYSKRDWRCVKIGKRVLTPPKQAQFFISVILAFVFILFPLFNHPSRPDHFSYTIFKPPTPRPLPKTRPRH